MLLSLDSLLNITVTKYSNLFPTACEISLHSPVDIIAHNLALRLNFIVQPATFKSPLHITQWQISLLTVFVKKPFSGYHQPNLLPLSLNSENTTLDVMQGSEIKYCMKNHKYVLKGISQNPRKVRLDILWFCSIAYKLERRRNTFCYCHIWWVWDLMFSLWPCS
jgi:hypothetical protein